jgi:glycosyltransferase involved in cell wall biosynthesis
MRLLPNGFDPALLDGRPSSAPDWDGQRVTLIHPGTLYSERTVSALVAAMGADDDLRDRLRLRILGNLNPDSESAIAARAPGVEVERMAPVPWAEAIDRVRDADIVVVIQPAALADDIAWPVKTFEALALGKPILAITSGGAVERLLQELGHAAGCARHGEVASIVAALRRLLGAPPRPVEAERLATWDRSRIAADYAALLESLVPR